MLTLVLAIKIQLMILDLIKMHFYILSINFTFCENTLNSNKVLLNFSYFLY